MELKPCPFCGSKVAPHMDEYWHHVGFMQVICDIQRGGCGASSGAFEDKEEPVEAWNSRVKED